MADYDWLRLPRRRNPRAKGFDYTTPGMYFVTQCTQDRAPILSSIADAQVNPTDIGQTVFEVLRVTTKRFTDTDIDCCCLMPDHLHFILALSIQTGRHGTSLIDFMRVFKSISAREYGRLPTNTSVRPARLWQRSYREEILEDDEELYAYRLYIQNNPLAYQLEKDGHAR